MPFGTRVWGAGKLLVLAAALAGTFFLFAAASMRIALRAREVEVPDFAGRTAAEARDLAADRGLVLTFDENRRIDPKVAEGRVLAQDPRPGTVLRQQRPVRLWLSAGARAASVPPLTGETERNAQMRLAQDGFALAALAEIRSSDYPPDTVVAQDPVAKSAAGEVSLLVNRVEYGATYVMPDLIGVNGEQAAAILRGQGFRVAVVGSMPYSGVPPGIVIRQSPQGGFQIAPGEPISIEVSR